jgi:hypothetical protein
MSRLLFPLLMLCGFLTSGFAVGSPLWNALSNQQKGQLLEGKPIMIEEDAAESPWPRLTIYYLVRSSPAKVAAVFWNSELDSQYLPNCQSVRILARPATPVQEAQFTLKMPFFLPNEVYVSRIEVKRPSSEIYDLSWRVLESLYAKECIGNVRTENEKGNALLCYKNFMIPKSSFAGLLRSQAGLRVEESVRALAFQVEKETESSSPMLKSQLEDLAIALRLPSHSVR